jgi:ABC-type glycerol-3-phosphate transport system permease component
MRPLDASARTVATMLALAVGVVFVSPLLWMAAASLKPDAAIHADVDSLRSFVPAEPTVANYRQAIRRGHVGTTFVNSLGVVFLIAFAGVLINAPAAYAFTRMRFPGSRALFALLILTIIVPLEVIVIPLFMTVRTTWGLAEVIGDRPWTWAALSVPFMAKGFNVFLFRQFFLGLPRALEDAAFIDGAGWWRTFWRVVMPNAKPVVITAILLDFTIHWNDFLWPLVVCQGPETHTVQIGLGYFFTQPPISWGAILAYSVLATIPMVILFAWGQRYVVASLSGTGVKG